RDRTTGGGQQAGVVVLHQLVDRLGRAGLVGPDVATRPALDPAGDIDAGHLDAAERVGHRAGELVERQVGDGHAAVADRSQDGAGLDLLELAGRHRDRPTVLVAHLRALDLDAL